MTNNDTQGTPELFGVSDHVLDILLKLLEPELQVFPTPYVIEGEVVRQTLPDYMRRAEYRATGKNIRDVLYCNPVNLEEICTEARARGVTVIVGSTLKEQAR
jgi:hypothetical protein